MLILGIELFVGLSSEGFDRLGDAHILLNIGLPPLGPFQPVVWFGVFSASILLLGLLATELARRRVDVNSHRAVSRALLALTIVIVVGMIAFGLTSAFWFAVTTYLVVNVARRVTGPLYTAWLNQHTESATRATVLSLEGQADALGQILGGPAVGAIGSAVSLPAALVVAGLALTPALALFTRATPQSCRSRRPLARARSQRNPRRPFADSSPQREASSAALPRIYLSIGGARVVLLNCSVR